MKPQSAKAKGRKLQQFVSQRVVEKNPELQADDIVSRPMGSGGIDLMMSPLAQRVVPLSIECKNTVKTPGLKEMEQATFNCYPNTFPVVAWKPKGAHYDDTLIMITLNDMLDLIKDLRSRNEN